MNTVLGIEDASLIEWLRSKSEEATTAENVSARHKPSFVDVVVEIPLTRGPGTLSMISVPSTVTVRVVRRTDDIARRDAPLDAVLRALVDADAATNMFARVEVRVLDAYENRRASTTLCVWIVDEHANIPTHETRDGQTRFGVLRIPARTNTDTKKHRGRRDRGGS